jgi:hypothetical protein
MVICGILFSCYGLLKVTLYGEGKVVEEKGQVGQISFHLLLLLSLSSLQRFSISDQRCTTMIEERIE